MRQNDDDDDVLIILETRRRRDFDEDRESNNYTNDCTKGFFSTETLNRPNCAITGRFIEAAGVPLRRCDFFKNKNLTLNGILLLLLCCCCFSYSPEELH
jgi:hypothetical protein